MNNLPYPFPQDLNNIIIQELKNINDTLKKIEYIISKNNKTENKYLEKDDNYYMI